MFQHFKLNEIMWVLDAKPFSPKYSLDINITGISTDTRNIKQGDLFVALRGANFDGNDFISEAERKGAAGIIADSVDKLDSIKIPVLICQNTQKSYAELAKWYLRGFDVQRIALTGSAGKTTTREMIIAILETKGEVLRNEANENNLIGVPKTIFNLNAAHKFIVLELGTNQKGEIAALTDIAQPDCSVLLNALPVHLEGLGDYQGVIKEKSAILSDLSDNEVAVVNYDDLGARTASLDCKARIISYGHSNRFEIFATDVNSSIDSIKFKLNGKYPFEVPIYGVHNISNILAAISVGWWAGVNIEEMQQALKNLKQIRLRNEVTKIRDAFVINDCYNANPASMIAAINMLRITSAKRKIAVVGDMLELGEFADFYHKKVATALVDSKIDIVITAGKLSKCIHDELVSKNLTAFYAEDANGAYEILQKLMQPYDLVLIKASNGLRFDKIYKSLLEDSSTKQYLTA